jgi:hypothetical protein
MASFTIFFHSLVDGAWSYISLISGRLYFFRRFSTYAIQLCDFSFFIACCQIIMSWVVSGPTRIFLKKERNLWSILALIGRAAMVIWRAGIAHFGEDLGCSVIPLCVTFLVQ